MKPPFVGNGATRVDPLDRAWAALPFLVPVLVASIAVMGATDLAYHLRAGATVLSGHIPRADTYTFTSTGAPWLDQQWLAQGALALAFRLGGWPLLVALQALLVGSAFWFVSLACRATGASVRSSSLLSLAGFLVAAVGHGMRPQLLGVWLFAALLWVTAGRRANPRRLWLAPVLAALCANVHGSFVLFPLVVGLAWLEDRRTHAPEAQRTLVIAVVTAGATLLSPFGLGTWRYAYELSTNDVIRDTISEWAPLTVTTVPGCLAIASAVAVVVFLVRRDQPTPWTALLTLGLFFVLALSAQRAIEWWAMVAPVVVAGLLDPGVAKEVDAASRRSGWPAWGIVALLVAAAIAVAPWWRGSSYDRFLSAAPQGLTEAARRALAPGTRTMVHQPWASWFEFELDEIPVFVDSRIEVTPDDVWRDYGQVAFARARWRDVLDRWDVQAIVAPWSWELLPVLREPGSGWKVTYEDAEGALLVRT